MAGSDFERWAKEIEGQGFPPVLLISGDKDPDFNLEMVSRTLEILKEKEIDVTLLHYRNAGHEHRPEWSQVIFDWIEKNL